MKPTHEEPKIKSKEFLPETGITSEDSEDISTPQIISPPITIALGIITTGMALLLIWSVTYRLPITTKAKGLLYQAPRLRSVKAFSDGLLIKLRVKNGDRVKKNEELARLDIKDITVLLSAANTQSELATQNTKTAQELIPKELNQQIIANEKSIADTLLNLKQQENMLEKQLSNILKYEKLKKQKYISEVEFLQYKEKAINLQNNIGQARAKYNSLIAKRNSTRRELENALNSARSNQAKTDADAQVHANKLQAALNLTSPIDGSVVQIAKWPGDLVEKGDELFVISPNGSKLTGAFLVSGNAAGRIKVGDEALISPSSAPPQRFGYIRGIVKSISPYPTNQPAYAGLVGSQTLAEDVFNSQEQKLPILVVVEPIYNKDILTWSGSSGPPWPIKSGILTEVKIVYQHRLPITYVIPWIRKITGVSNF